MMRVAILLLSLGLAAGCAVPNGEGAGQAPAPALPVVDAAADTVSCDELRASLQDAPPEAVPDQLGRMTRCHAGRAAEIRSALDAGQVTRTKAAAQIIATRAALRRDVELARSRLAGLPLSERGPIDRELDRAAKTALDLTLDRT